jgi:hypothetical protein
MLAAAVAHDVQITVSSVSVAIANLAQAVGVSSDSVVKVHLVSSSVEPPERPFDGPLKLFNEPPLPLSSCPACETQNHLAGPILGISGAPRLLGRPPVPRGEPDHDWPCEPLYHFR